MLRKAIAGLAIGLGAAAIVLTLAALDVLDTVELSLYDWRMRLAVTDPPDVHPDIVIVELNDTTIRDLDETFGRWPWPRAATAMVVDFLARGPAKVIAVDFAFTEQDRVALHRIGTAELSGADSDAVLAESVKAAGSAILLADATYEGLTGGEVTDTPTGWSAEPYRLGPGMYERRTITTPFPALAEAAAGVAHNYAVLDKRGSLRRIPPFVRMGDRYMPSLGVAAALRGAGIRARGGVARRPHAAAAGPRDPAPLGPGARRGRSLPHARAVDDARELPGTGGAGERRAAVPALRAAAPDPVRDPAAVGRGADGRPRGVQGQDRLRRPDGIGPRGHLPDPVRARGQGRMPGVQMHASVADSILSNRFITPAGRGWRIASVVAAALAVGLLTAFLPFTGAATAAAVAMLRVGALCDPGLPRRALGRA